jgi:hypothetical protein
MRALKILSLSAAAVVLVCLGSLLPWRVLAENLSAFDGTVYSAIRLANLANISQTVGGGTATLSGGTDD